MIDFIKILGFDSVYDDSFKVIFPIFKKLGIKTSHTIASESGYYTNLLNINGINCSGSDIFSGIVNLSKNRYPNIDFSVKDMRNFNLSNKVDLISCMDGCINHVFSLNEIYETFTSVYKNLNNKGYFYFEFWTLKEVGDGKKTKRKKEFYIKGYNIKQIERRLGNNIYNVSNIIEKNGKIIDILNAYHTSFKYDKVIKLLKKSGFKKYIEISHSNDFSKNILAFKY